MCVVLGFVVLCLCLWPLSAQGQGTRAATKPASKSATNAETDAIFEYMKYEFKRVGPANLALVFAIAYLLPTLAMWPISRLFAGREGTFGNLVLYVVMQWVVMIVIVVAMGVLIFLAVMAHAPPAALGVVVLALIAMLLSMFMVPMRIYDLGFFRTLGMLICGTIAAGAIQASANVLIPPERIPMRVLATMDREEVPAYIRQWKTEQLEKRKMAEEAAASKADQATSAPADLWAMYRELEETRKQLDPSDAQAVADYNRKAADYKNLMAQPTKE